MGLVLADVGAVQILKKFFRNELPAGGNNYTLKLYTNSLTPADTHVAGDFVEAAGGGYAAKSLTAANFTVSTVAGIAQAAYATQTWTFTGYLTTNFDINGYFIVDGDGVLIYAEKGNPFTPTTNGDTYSVTPKLQLSKGNVS